MERLIITFLILVVTDFVYPGNNTSVSSCEKDDCDSLLIELLENRNPVVYENINPRDSIYIIQWFASFDLEGKRKERFPEMLNIIVIPKEGRAFGVWNAQRAKQFGMDSIYQKVQQRLHKYLTGLNVHKLINDKSPCISNRFKFAESIHIVFNYRIRPRPKGSSYDCSDAEMLSD